MGAFGERLEFADIGDPNRESAVQAAIQAYGAMDAIATNCSAHLLELGARNQEAKSAGDEFLATPAGFESDLLERERDFSLAFAGGVLDLVDRADAHAFATDGIPVERVIVRPDLDGTLVPLGDDCRYDLRPGFIPTVRFLQQRLAPRDIAVYVAPLSDRPQEVLEYEAAALLPELAEDGTLLFDHIASAKDGILVRGIRNKQAELVTQQSNASNQDEAVLEARITAVAPIITADSVINLEAYHEKAAILALEAYGPGATPGTVYFSIDDYGFAGLIKANSRVAGLQVSSLPGGLGPLSPGDITYLYRSGKLQPRL